ncbi:CIC11C00000001113 [Sungouiella intermedia]|uniref:CIC11C00000001113 n=1 Tax=Sungouiella intermedia TaxID=45354 RepID=A0A1L0C397_9ASCO|nr:CIC11C00000001113 [[Candida] intermedia]
MVNYHLIVLVHGVWGNPSHMGYLAHQIEKMSTSNPSDEIVVYRTGSHSGYLTYDGVDINGKRIADEIVAKKDALNGEEGTVTKFSLVGYSMGGLVSRYALGILYHQHFFETIEPVNFATFCTPHVGIVNPSLSLLARLYNMIGPHTIAETGRQFFLRDKLYGHDDYVPLLQWMSDPASKFYKALEIFENRSLYANAINDRRTSWYSTSICDVDPFNSMVNESLSAYDMKYIDGYSPTIIDFSQPITFRKVEPIETPGLTLQRFFYKTLTWLGVLGQFILITPIYSLFLLANAIWQRVKMNRRLKDFYRDGADSLLALYEIVHDEVAMSSEDQQVEDEEKQTNGDDYSDSDAESFMGGVSERIRDQTDIFIESIFSAVNSKSYFDYHYSVSKPSKGLTLENLGDNSETPLLEDKPLVNLKGQKVTTDFKLNLTDLQYIIVANLNTLKWNKFPVIIRDTKATHAAIIHRHNDPTFSEGRVVVRHFVEQVLKA